MPDHSYLRRFISESGSADPEVPSVTQQTCLRPDPWDTLGEGTQWWVCSPFVSATDDYWRILLALEAI